MAFLVVLDGSINFDALRLEILQAQITFHWSATRTTYQFTCMTSHLKIKTCMYDVFSYQGHSWTRKKKNSGKDYTPINNTPQKLNVNSRTPRIL